MENIEAKKTTNENEVEVEKDGVSRRQFLKIAGVFTGFAMTKPAEAAKLIEEATRGEQKPEKGEPRVSINIFYAAHAMEKDIEKLDESMEGVDVFIPEMAGWNEKRVGMFRDISEGKLTAEQALKKQRASPEKNTFRYYYHKKFYDSFYNTQKRIEVIDIPENSPIFKDLVESLKVRFDFGKDFEENLNEYKKRGKKYADMQKKREEYILAKLKELRGDITKNPSEYDLNKNGEVKLLLQLGAVHTRIYHSLYKDDENVSRKFNKMPFVFGSHGTEALRRNLFGKEVSNELTARSILELALPNALFYELKELPDDYGYIFSAQRAMAEMFSYDEIKKIFESVEPSPWSWYDFSEKIKEAMKKKGVVPPKTKKDLENFVDNLKKE